MNSKTLALETIIKKIEFLKESGYYSMKCLKIKGLWLLATKLIEKLPDPSNAKECYNSYLKRKKNTKS